MSHLTIDLQPDVFERLRGEAARTGKSIELLASELLARQLPPVSPSERERTREVLRAAGLLTELGPELKRRAAEATLSLEEIQEILRRVGGKPLSEIVIEQRGPKP
jgi:plasmid stability protein